MSKIIDFVESLLTLEVVEVEPKKTEGEILAEFLIERGEL